MKTSEGAKQTPLPPPLQDGGAEVGGVHQMTLEKVSTTSSSNVDNGVAAPAAESLQQASTTDQSPLAAAAGRVTMPSVNSPSATLMSPAHYAMPPNVQISGMMSPAGANQRYSVMGFDPSQLMILQQVDGQGKVTTSPAVTAMDALKLGLVPTTPLMAMSPMAAPTLVAPPGTPMATYNPADPSGTIADWSQHYLQIANLQNRTTGFLSPAGQPLSPAPMVHGAAWTTLTTTSGTPGLVATPLSMRTSVPPMDVNGTPNKQIDDRNSDSRTREASEKATDGPGLSAATHATEDNHIPSPQPHAWLSANGYSPFPTGAYASIPHIMPPANLILSKGQSDAATAGTTSSNKVAAEDHLSLFAPSATAGVNGQPDFTSPNGLPGSKPDGRLVDTVLHAKSLTEQMLREFSVEGAADVLRTALSLLGRPSTGGGGGGGGGDGGTDTQTTVGDLGDLSAGATSTALPSVKLVHPDEFKNASTFLKIYGDPLCFTKNGPLPKKGRNGNWECSKCNNVNFPRRFRCNMCSTTRDEEGDRVVSEYARQVYERYIFIYRNQQSQNGGVHHIILDRDPLVVETQPPPPPSSNQSGALPHSSQVPNAAAAVGTSSRQQGGNFHQQQQPQTQHNTSYARNSGGANNRSYGTSGGGGNATRPRYSRGQQHQYDNQVGQPQQQQQHSVGYNTAAAYGNNPQYAVSHAVAAHHQQQQQQPVQYAAAAAGRQDYGGVNYY